MDTKKLIVVAPIIAMSSLIACSDDSNNASPQSKALRSCYFYSIEDGEACIEAEMGTPSADSIEILCITAKKNAEGNPTIDLGEGCPTEKEAVYTCKPSNPQNSTHYFYILDDDQTDKLVVKNDYDKTCKNLVWDNETFYSEVVNP